MLVCVIAGRVLEGTLSLGQLRRGSGAAPSVTPFAYLPPPPAADKAAGKGDSSSSSSSSKPPVKPPAERVRAECCACLV
jgi:hypothetical protein